MTCEKISIKGRADCKGRPRSSLWTKGRRNFPFPFPPKAQHRLCFWNVLPQGTLIMKGPDPGMPEKGSGTGSSVRSVPLKSFHFFKTSCDSTKSPLCPPRPLSPLLRPPDFLLTVEHYGNRFVPSSFPSPRPHALFLASLSKRSLPGNGFSKSGLAIRSSPPPPQC